MRGRLIFIPTLHVRKQEAAKTKMGNGAWRRRAVRAAQLIGRKAHRHKGKQRIAYGNRHSAHRVDTILR